MSLKRVASLQLILLIGLGSVFLVPKDVELQSAAINSSLPEFVENWRGADSPVSQNEREVLGNDTQFVRKLYTKGTDQIFVSIVLSGADMNTSIHRPERCLPAQGWTVADSKPVQVPLKESVLRATRLQNIRAISQENGEPVNVRNLSYYWFVGHSDITSSHYERTWIDIRDRVLKGCNQQWAYVMVSSVITKNLRVFGRDEEQTDQMIKDFIRDLAPNLQEASGAATAGGRISSDAEK
jgi:EpsI family protein